MLKLQVNEMKHRINKIRFIIQLMFAIYEKLTVVCKSLRPHR